MIETFLGVYLPVAGCMSALLFLCSDGLETDHIISLSLFWPLYLLKYIIKSFLLVFKKW